MRRMTPGLAPPLSLLPRHTSGRAAGLIYCGSSVESGCEPGTRRPQNRDLTTRPPRPPRKWDSINCSLSCFSPRKSSVKGERLTED
ncbi:hypothetical protein AVEN_253669-1 [Araneus ventricosus]|uniref:Uncharacterized protein n=1 Tax=Araneus ventricosus TaxID=182803 RepID=A0A4Y2QLD8_ARAVE|nr:hypothetical protein AVEN_253669-1 [Araneus ventricosus]